MINILKEKHYGTSDLGWLKSRFHFSFANYFNPDNMNFGKLRVLNDDLVVPGGGFDTHPHRDMEIISYVVDGALTHADNMGHEKTLRRGHIQYMSAGKGVEHSEHNRGDETLRFLQIWIIPEKKGLEPQYGDYAFDWELRQNKWLHMVSGLKGQGQVKVNQDVNIYSLSLEAGQIKSFEIRSGRQAYLLQIEGRSLLNEKLLEMRDAAEIIEENIELKAQSDSHFLVIEMAKSDDL